TKPKDPKVILDAKAVAILRSALDYLKNTKGSPTTLSNRITLDAGPDKKMERTAKYELAVERPNKMAMIIKDGKLRCAILSDGKLLCTYAPELKKYTQKEAPKTMPD